MEVYVVLVHVTIYNLKNELSGEHCQENRINQFIRALKKIFKEEIIAS